MRGPRREFLFQALLVLLGAGLPLAALEIGLRAAGYAGSAERKAFVFTDDYGDLPKDSWLGRLIGKDGELVLPDPLEINDETVPILKPGAEVRILFLGDSATYGTGVGLASSYPAMVRGALQGRFPGRLVRVINAGIPGLDTADEVRIFEAVLRRLKPDVVIVGLFMANDINFNLKDESFLRDDGGRATESALTRLMNRSALAHFATLGLRAANNRFHWSQAKGGFPPGRRALSVMDSRGLEFLDYQRGEIALYLKNPSETAARAYDVLEGIFGRLAEDSRIDGFRFGVLLIPTSSTLAGRLEMNLYSPESARKILSGLGLDESGLDFDRPTREVLGACRRLRISCFDPTAAMRKLGAARVIIPGDDHPSLPGHVVLAQTALEGISPWLPARP